MKLQAYLAEADVKPSAFAVRLSVNPSTITRLIAGTRLPSGVLIKRIERVTDGLVKFEDYDWPGDE